MNPSTLETPAIPSRATVLRAALLANATFSAACAALLVTSPSQVAAWLGIQQNVMLPVIGIGLLLFAVDLMHQASRRRMASWRALYASAADFLWVLGTGALLLFFPDLLSPGGNLIVGGIAVVVLAFALWQLRGIDLLHRTPDGGLHRHCILVEVDADPRAMWQILSRLDAIALYMPALKSSTIRDKEQPGLGCVRECTDHAGRRWAEACTDFREGRGFTVEFLCQEPGFPFPVSAMKGGWEVLRKKEEPTCAVMVWWELRPKPRWLAPVLLPMLAFQADHTFPKVMRNMAAAASGALAAAAPAPRTRLLGQPC